MSSQVRGLYKFGPFQLNADRRVLLRDGEPVAVEPKVCDLLVVLVENKGRLVHKDELIEKVWPDSFVEEGNLTGGICKLRKALGESEREEPYIETVPCRGYRFVGCVTETLRQSADLAAGAAAQTQVHATSQGRAKRGTIAVLPFKSIGAIGNEYLGLGIADALITRLSNLRRMTVRPTSSVRKYNGAQDPVLAGRELKVESVLDGSVQKCGRRIRVTAQLVNVSKDSLLWAGKFDEKLTNVFEVEDSISKQVATALAPKVTRSEKKRLSKRHTNSPEAYEAYLKGRYFFGKRSNEGLEKGIECFNRAIAIDANYALAYSGLADCYGLLGTHGVFPAHESNLRTEQAALRSIELDGEVAEAHASLGHLRLRQWDWLSAEKELKQAIRVNPNYATARNWYAQYLQLVGRSDDAIIQNKKALELDPLSVVFRSTRGKLLYFARQYNLAIEQLLSALGLDPHYYLADHYLGLVYEAVGSYDKALVAFEQATTGFGEVPELRACVARLHALSGRRSEAMDAIDELTRLSKERYVQPYFLALIYAALGDKDEAFSWLERGFEERDEDLVLLKVDQRVDDLRSDSRLAELLRRMGLANATNRRTLEAASGGRPG